MHAVPVLPLGSVKHRGFIVEPREHRRRVITTGHQYTQVRVKSIERHQRDQKFLHRWFQAPQHGIGCMQAKVDAMLTSLGAHGNRSKEAK